MSAAAPQPMVTGIGELLWDLLPSGPRIGGAPANFACHARSLGARASVISRVGEDEAGTTLLEHLRATGLGTHGIQKDAEHATGAVDVLLDETGQPDFKIRPDAAWDHIQADARALAIMAETDAVCFGSLSQRHIVSRETIRRLVAAARPDAWRVFDVNLRQDHYDEELLDASLRLANACKLSDSELPVLASLFGIAGSVEEKLARLADLYQLRAVVYTRGARGSILLHGGESHDHPGYPAQVRDTIGAGDSFNAAVTMGLLQGWPVDRISDTANAVAAHVCSCDGAMPPLPAALRERFHWQPVPDAAAMAV